EDLSAESIRLGGRKSLSTQARKFKCTVTKCNKRFTRVYDCDRHVKDIHQRKSSEVEELTCLCGDRPFARDDSLRRHLRI
ncbi:hypothetical protein DFH09DRAFT_815046, partial [Mycena vulgaris]